MFTFHEIVVQSLSTEVFQILSEHFLNDLSKKMTPGNHDISQLNDNSISGLTGFQKMPLLKISSIMLSLEANQNLNSVHLLFVIIQFLKSCKFTKSTKLFNFLDNGQFIESCNRLHKVLTGQFCR